MIFSTTFKRPPFVGGLQPSCARERAVEFISGHMFRFVMWCLVRQLAFFNEMEMNSGKQLGSGGIFHNYDNLTSAVELWVTCLGCLLKIKLRLVL